jgi:hypothetical protein
MKKLISRIAAGLAGTSFSSSVWVSLFLTLTFAPTCYSVPIIVLETQYTTAALGGSESVQISPVPISDSLVIIATNPFTGVAGNVTVANANAGLLEVSGNTSAFGDYTSVGYSTAYAESDLWFSPVASQTASINIQYYAEGHNGSGYYTSGNFSLVDVTSGNELWNYGWDNAPLAGVYGAPSGINIGTLIQFTDGASGNLTVDTDLNASDTYELIMRTGSDAADDSEQESIQLTGLEPVPEPSTFALICMGSLALALVRRHRG